MGSPIGVARRRRPAKQPRRPSLRDVALRSGVSVATASRALTRPELVSDSLRLTVTDAAAALAYRPNVAARALSSSSSHLVGAVLGDPLGAVSWRAFASFERVLREAGVGALVALPETGAGVEECARGLELQGAQPVAIFNGQRSDGADVRSRIHVDAGLRAGSLLALRYLFRLGHRHIAAMASAESGDMGDSPDLAGLRLVVLGGPDSVSTEVVAAFVRQWRALPDPPTALVCGSDDVALRAWSACRESGIGVPEDLSIVGHGDTELARGYGIALTTVRVGAEVAGADAARRCMSIDPRSPRIHVPPVRLVVRASCAPRIC